MLSTLDRELLATYLRPERRRLVGLGALLLSGIGLQLANPLIARSFIDGAQSGAPSDELIRTAVVFVAVALATQVVEVAEACVATNLGWRTTNALRVDLARHVLGLDASFHTRHNAGQLVERIDGDVSAVARFFSRFVVYVFGNAVFLVGVLLLLFVVDWRVGASLTVFAAVALLFMTKGGGFVGRRAKVARATTGDLSGFLEERLGGLVDIKGNGADAHVMDGLEARMAERNAATRSSFHAGSLFGASVSGLFVLGSGASLALSSSLQRSGALTIGSVYVVFRYTGMLRRPLEMLARQMHSFQQATGGLVRIQELFRERATLVDGPGAALPPGALAVEFDHVHFGYDRTPVLRNVSFRVEPGEVLGLLGRTGSGKTTVSRLLFRLHDPGGGTVRLGGVDLRAARVADVRQRIGLVTQEVQLFDGTLRDNVTLFDANVPDDEVESVFADLGLGPWLAALPDGVATELGVTGRGLSAGEAQLVALARVFLADPGVIVLDEASSRLDPATERLLATAIDRLFEGRTAIVIAHRLDTVARADRIVILDGGAVAEQGRRADLAADPDSRFARLLRAGLEEVPA